MFDPSSQERQAIDTTIQKLFILRHGACGGDSLTPTGEQQARTLATRIKGAIGSQPFSILSSTAWRARQTAEIIHQELAGPDPLLLSDCLWDDSSHTGNEEEGLRMILACTTPIVIAVTHKELAPELIHLFAKRVLEKENAGHVELGYGQGYTIDCTLKTIVSL